MAFFFHIPSDIWVGSFNFFGTGDTAALEKEGVFIAQEQEVLRMIQQVSGMMLDTGRTVSDIAVQILEELERLGMSNSEYRETKKLLKGEADVLNVPTREEAEELQTRMEAHGIRPCTVLQTSKGASLYTPTSEREKAQEIVNRYQAETSQGRHVSKSQLAEYSRGDAQEIRVPEAEAILLTDRYEKAHIPVCVADMGKGEARILFASKDAEAAERIRTDLCSELYGDHGEILREQAEWKNEYKTNMLNVCIRGEIPDPKGFTEQAEPLPNGTVFMDREGNTLTFRDGFVLTAGKEENLCIDRRDTRAVQNACKVMIDRMRDPVMLTEEEAKDFGSMSARERSDAIIRKQREDRIFSETGRPSYSRETIREAAMARSRVENTENALRRQGMRIPHDQSVVIQLEKAGVDVPESRVMNLFDAAEEYGFTVSESGQFASFGRQEAGDSVSSESVREVMKHCGKPADPVRDLDAEIRRKESERNIFNPEQSRSRSESLEREADTYHREDYRRDNYYNRPPEGPGPGGPGGPHGPRPEDFER